MKLLIVSDTHRSFEPLLTLVQRYQSRIDMVIHLGDGEDDIEDLGMAMPKIALRHVAGNCDYRALSPAFDTIELEGVRIFFTHGHIFGVDYTLDKLAAEARKNNASVALFGHTHRQSCKEVFGVRCINPGSLTSPRDGKFGYALLELNNGQESCSLMQVNH